MTHLKSYASMGFPENQFLLLIVSISNFPYLLILNKNNHLDVENLVFCEFHVVKLYNNLRFISIQKFSKRLFVT